MSGLTKAILDSKKTIMQRFKKLYRTLYIQFINKDTMHKKDLQKIIETLNLRITTLETTMNANFKATDANIAAAITGHLHLNPQAPAGSLLSGPGALVLTLPPSPPSVTTGQESQVNSLSNGEPELNSRMGALAGQGPATAPMSDQADLEAQAANIRTVSDIAVGEGPGV